VIFYAVSVGLARLLLALEWWYIIKGPIRTSDDLDSRLARYNFFRGFAIPLIFLISRHLLLQRALGSMVVVVDVLG
jgi:hypothetical protein